MYLLIFFFNDPATTDIYTLSLHDALPIYRGHELGVALGIDNVDARAERSNGGGGARQTAAMRRGVDADREPRHDAQSGVAQRLGEALGVMLALRRGVAAADDGERGMLQKLSAAERIKDGRRVRRLQQCTGIVFVGKRDDVVSWGSRPVQRARYCIAHGRGVERLDDRRCGVRGQLGAPSFEDRLWQAELAQHAADRAGTKPGR